MSQLDVDAVMSHVGRLRVPQMKDVCRQLHERVGGTRADLMQRIRFVCEQRSGKPESLEEVMRIIEKVSAPTIPTSTVSSSSQNSTSWTNANYSQNASTFRPTLGMFTSTPSIPPTMQIYPENTQKQVVHKFRSTPFFKPGKAILSKIVSCDSGRAMFVVSLTKEQLDRITNDGEVVMLFVGPENGITLKPNPFRGEGIPIEYPPLEGAHSNAPNHCHIIFNNGMIPSAQYAGIRGKPWTAKPLDLTKGLHKNTVANNVLELRFTPARRHILVTIQSGRMVSVSEIVSTVKQSSLVSKDVVISDRTAKSKADEDVCLTEEHVSLKDPVTRCRINVPARGRDCQHPQCFDLEYFLVLNQTHPTWTCPVCSKLTPLSDVFVDGFFIELLLAASTDPDVESAEIAPDGTWRLNREICTGVSSDTSDDEGPSKPSKAEEGSTAAATLDTRSSTVIDLTLSDDDGAPPPLPAPPPPPPVQPAPGSGQETLPRTSPAANALKRPHQSGAPMPSASQRPRLSSSDAGGSSLAPVIPNVQEVLNANLNLGTFGNSRPRHPLPPIPRAASSFVRPSLPNIPPANSPHLTSTFAYPDMLRHSGFQSFDTSVSTLAGAPSGFVTNSMMSGNVQLRPDAFSTFGPRGNVALQTAQPGFHSNGGLNGTSGSTIGEVTSTTAGHAEVSDDFQI